ncbi:XRN 5'-3' exonuclease N-terminus-domain-containing protein [Phakopsora pachyrhizi]|nr:XRN 5'-3' exonuclease N-terminus-domain-containing protein [Phakopsora pachyrhizi]
MGVPALFRWLSKKYPKIVEQVVEDEPIRCSEVESAHQVIIRSDMSHKNPNGTEFDNLYLDMNGIVHPCTHPEGKKPPETEQEMMVEVFRYTDRVVNMVRPRKLLMIAIDGVAPRAKMNQQRSRRFRAAQEAKSKHLEKLSAMQQSSSLAKGDELSGDNHTTDNTIWDSNAITPGTPFMKLLTDSLRYWIVHKLNTDPGWKHIQVILSDASVPGEGEHKIMEFIRRSRTQPSYDPNTRHVIYGLDADLIMLSLATHEPHFKVLREDVFSDERRRKGCHLCGQPGHHSSQCQGKPKERADEFDVKQKPTDRKPFIFLDVSTLREYLAVELNVVGTSFKFELERAIDDWVLLIFFVGNDFLPHLPSLEIREGAIDCLLKIWKTNLARMGGYLTDCGQLSLSRTEIILEALAAREEEIFRKRREAEERQDHISKRRKIEADSRQRNMQFSHNSPPHLTLPNSTGSSSLAPGLPPKPSFSPTGSETISRSGGIPGLGVIRPTSSSPDRSAIRSANLDAAAMLKAELCQKVKSETPVKSNVKSGTSDSTIDTTSQLAVENSTRVPQTAQLASQEAIPDSKNSQGELDEGNIAGSESTGATLLTISTTSIPSTQTLKRKVDDLGVDPSPESLEVPDNDVVVLSDDDDEEEDDDEDEPGNVSVLVPGQPSKPAPLKMLGNNMVEQDDTVKLWEPGFRERYFRQKFGIELSDEVEKRKIVKFYVEGLAWVLGYYYQGCQSWQWFYPYHYSPFAADFTNLEEFEINFDIGKPSKPYEQLMGVFPAASKSHIPSAYHDLMTSDDSPIKDFYPEEFEIDMNGKKMLWQGVALLPFIEQDRLLDTMRPIEKKLSVEDRLRNEDGDVVIFCREGHPQYDNICNIYRKRDTTEPIELNPSTAEGVFGSALPDPNCVPGSTFHSPLPTIGLPDISNDKSLFAKFYFPPQLVPHRSVLLEGVKLEKRVLNNYDREVTRYGGNPNSSRPGNSYGDGFHQQRREFGDGPSVISNHYSGGFHSFRGGMGPNQNSSGRGGVGSSNNSYGANHLNQQYSQTSYNNNSYSRNFQPTPANRGGHQAYSGYNGPSSRGGYGGYGNGNPYNNINHQSANYSGTTNYGNDYGGGHTAGSGAHRPSYGYSQNSNVTGNSYMGSHSNLYFNHSPQTGGGGYGGTGIGNSSLNYAQQTAGPGGQPYGEGGYRASDGSTRGAFKQQPIVPAVTRTDEKLRNRGGGNHHYAQNGPNRGKPR